MYEKIKISEFTVIVKSEWICPNCYTNNEDNGQPKVDYLIECSSCGEIYRITEE